MGARSWQVALGLVAITHLVAQLLGARTWADGTQVLLIPALAGLVWSAGLLPARAWSTRAYATALLLSWLGDALPRVVDGDASFLVMVTLFLGAQVGFILTYVLLTRSWPAVLVMAAYAVVFGALYLLCAPGAGSLLPLVAGYGLLLVTAGSLSSTVSVVTGIGGAMFVGSDALIALHQFVEGYALPQHDFLVMLTYIGAQVLIAYGLLSRARADARPASLGDAAGGRSAEPGDRSTERPA
ncbi:lysoplasmalogenase [Ruania zhangjianzhongii]|uniref:lysoplasmalogenase n=1 Tax=Ruania zhangjianzhongii TaxID=2603206 RepID=UPI0011CA80D6|nr:lysoplasmalogenase [Ruania zhangjianzhongii]